MALPCRWRPVAPSGWSTRSAPRRLPPPNRSRPAFRELLRREGLDGGWRLVEGNLPATVALHARYADLTVLGQANPYEHRDGLGHDAVVVSTVMSSGRPVLAVPFAGDFPTLGQRVLVAWNASREAARAVNDALPLLARPPPWSPCWRSIRGAASTGMATCRPRTSRCTWRGTACVPRRRIPWRPTSRTARRCCPTRRISAPT